IHAAQAPRMGQCSGMTPENLQSGHRGTLLDVPPTPLAVRALLWVPILISVGLIVLLVGAFGWGLAVFTFALVRVPAAWGVRYRRRLRHEAAVNPARARERHEQFLTRYAEVVGAADGGNPG